MYCIFFAFVCFKQTLCSSISEEQGPARNDEGHRRNIAPGLKERLPSGSTHKELFTEVEKQYVVVTAPKVSPKPKKSVKDSLSGKSNEKSATKISVDTKMEGSVSHVDGKVEGGNHLKHSLFTFSITN